MVAALERKSLKLPVAEQRAPAKIADVAPPKVVETKGAPPKGASDAYQGGTRAESTTVVGNKSGPVFRFQLEAKLDEAKGASATPPTVDGPLPSGYVPQPNLPTISLGAYAPLAVWIDQNCGNKDGMITADELLVFTQRYGADPQHQAGILGLTALLGIQALLHQSLGLAGAQAQQLRAPTGQSYAMARALVRTAGTATPYQAEEAVRTLASLPVEVLSILQRRGTQVVVAGNILEYRPDLSFEKPRGWPPGSTWAQPSGLHDSMRNEIVVSAGMGTSPRVLLHEVGHALDAAGFNASLHQAFTQMYNADSAALQRDSQSYLLQPGNAGLSEAFAESHMWYQTSPDWMRSAYPNLHAYWQWAEQNRWTPVGGQ